MGNAPLKLNLGSGTKRIDGFLNVDHSEECKPDIVMNLEQVPYDFADNSVSHIIMSHVLEHLGQTPQNFLAIMRELYRICRDGALLDITVPHPSHDHFLSDPTHVRPITPGTLALFDREENLRWRQIGATNTPRALQCGVNFKIINFRAGSIRRPASR
jgi:methyltransferase family protein